MKVGLQTKQTNSKPGLGRVANCAGEDSCPADMPENVDEVAT